MSSIPNLADVLVENLNDNTKPKEATFVETYTSIEGHVDGDIKPAIEQIMRDTFTAGYDYGDPAYATPLEDAMSKKAEDESFAGAKTFEAETTFQADVTSNSKFTSSGQPRCFVWSSANQSIATSSYTATENLSFDTEVYDVGGMFAPTSTTIVIPSGADGLYAFVAQVNFAANATGVRRLALFKNGTEVARVNTTDCDATEETFLQLSYQCVGTADDAFALRVYQSSGGALNALTGSALTFFSCMKVW